MNIAFFEQMDKIPTITAQQKGIDFKHKKVYTKPEVIAIKNRYTAMFLKHMPQKRFEGAIALKVVFRFPVTKGHHNGEWKITRPDTDNMLKLLKDCGTGIMWQDDSQISMEVVMKKYAEPSGIYFEAYTLGEIPIGIDEVDT